VQLRFAPGTQANVSPPTLRKILANRIEPWPKYPSGDNVEGGLTQEEQDILEALGYL
jgi:hypothetical protein